MLGREATAWDSVWVNLRLCAGQRKEKFVLLVTSASEEGNWWEAKFLQEIWDSLKPSYPTLLWWWRLMISFHFSAPGVHSSKTTKSKLEHHLQTGTASQSPQRDQKVAGWGVKLDSLPQTIVSRSNLPKCHTSQERSTLFGATGKDTQKAGPGWLWVDWKAMPRGDTAWERHPILQAQGLAKMPVTPTGLQALSFVRPHAVQGTTWCRNQLQCQKETKASQWPK